MSTPDFDAMPSHGFSQQYAGSCFNELEEGQLRLVTGGVLPCLSDEERPGILVQEVIEDSTTGRLHWETVCPLSDACFMVSNAPLAWYRASVELRDIIEAGGSVDIAAERAALASARKQGAAS